MTLLNLILIENNFLIKRSSAFVHCEHGRTHALTHAYTHSCLHACAHTHTTHIRGVRQCQTPVIDQLWIPQYWPYLQFIKRPIISSPNVVNIHLLSGTSDLLLPSIAHCEDPTLMNQRMLNLVSFPSPVEVFIIYTLCIYRKTTKVSVLGESG